MADLHRLNRVMSVFGVVSVLGVFGGARVVYAHIDVDGGGTHMGRTTATDLKDAPCGVTGSKRGTKIYKYKPGTTINLSLVETIAHAGYFRISFDTDGDDGFKDPKGTSGMSGNCAGDANCGPGKEDYCNNETVLLDALDQHARGATKTYTWSVKLPDVECANCTLQVIQIMNDLNVHPGAFPAGDIYYQCIDIELSNSAPDVPAATPVTNNGMECKKAPPAGTAGAGGGAAGSAAGASGGMAAAGASGAAPVAGAGGAAPSGQAGAAGAATVTAGRPATAAGSPAPAPAGSRASTSAGSPAAGGSAGAGTITSPVSTAGAAPAAAAPAADSGGCAMVATGEHRAQNAGLVFVALGLLALARRRRRKARNSP